MNDLKIIKAVYYDPKAGPATGTDVTDELSRLVKDGRLVYDGKYNDIFPDNFRTIVKKLRIELNFKWKNCVWVYSENEKINLPKDLNIKDSTMKKFLNNKWTVAIGSGLILIVIGYFISKSSITQKGKNNQMHTGSGDNVAGDKVIKIGTTDDDKIRQLESMESGKSIAKLSDDVFFFESSSSITMAIKSNNISYVTATKITSNNLSDLFEIQKNKGENLLVGYINTENYSKAGIINEKNPLKNFYLFPFSFSEYSKLVAIPFEDITEIYNQTKDMGEKSIDVIELSASKIILDVTSHKN